MGNNRTKNINKGPQNNTNQCRFILENGRRCSQTRFRRSYFCWSHIFRSQVQWIPIACAIVIFLLGLGIDFLFFKESKKGTDQLHRSMNSFAVNDYPKLSNTYSLGYCLFALDHTAVMTPHDSKLSAGYKMDWDTANVKNYSSNGMTFVLPSIYRFGDPDPAISGVTLTVPREVGAIACGPLIIDDMKICTEILADDDHGTVALIGFQPNE